jgi:hypothetical protein
MKKIEIFLLLALSILTLNQNTLSAEISSNLQKLVTAKNFTLNKKCSNYEKIEGKKYCVKRSSITLNSCGRESDWPCMEANGCLVISKFTLQD